MSKLPAMLLLALAGCAAPEKPPPPPEAPAWEDVYKKGVASCLLCGRDVPKDYA